MSARIGALHVMLGLDSAEFQTGLSKADKKVGAFAKDTKSELGQVGIAFKGAGSAALTFGKTLVAGLLVGGLAGTVTQIAAIAKAIATVGDEAKRAGLSLQAFQELKFLAEQNRIGVDALTDGLKELNLRADEFITTGTGSAAEAFQRLGYDAATLAQKLKDPSALFSEIIGKLGKFDRAAQIRIADEIFGGTGGEKFVQLLGQSEQQIKATIQQAHSLGTVMDDELVAKAAELDRAFMNVATTVGNELQGAITNAAFSLYDFIQRFQGFEARSTESLKQQYRDFGLEKIDLEGQRITVETERRQSGGANAMIFETRLADIKKRMHEIIELEAQIGAQLDARAPVVPASIDGPGAGGGTFGAFSSVFGGKASGGGRSAAISETQRQQEAVAALIAGLEFERATIGLSAVDLAKLNALRQAGAGATDAQRAQIEMLIESTHSEQLRVDQLTNTFDMLGQVGQTAIQGITAAFADGKIEGQEMLGILGNILSMVGSSFLNSAFSGIGAGFKIPGFANGTNFAPGGLSLVGERGPELVNLPRGSQVIPNHELGKGGGLTVQIDARGAQVGVAEQLDQWARFKLPALVNSINNDPLARG